MQTEAAMGIARSFFTLGLVLALAGCGMGNIGGVFKRKPAEVPVEAALPEDDTIEISSLPVPASSTVEALDRTTENERAAAAAPQVGGQRLGTTIASLGDPTKTGFWLRTPLVDTPAKGRVEGANGASVSVDLLPLDADPGAGSQISLSAMRVLGVSLTDLPELIVYRF